MMIKCPNVGCTLYGVIKFPSVVSTAKKKSNVLPADGSHQKRKQKYRFRVHARVYPWIVSRYAVSILNLDFVCVGCKRKSNRYAVIEVTRNVY